MQNSNTLVQLLLDLLVRSRLRGRVVLLAAAPSAAPAPAAAASTAAASTAAASTAAATSSASAAAAASSAFAASASTAILAAGERRPAAEAGRHKLYVNAGGGGGVLAGGVLARVGRRSLDLLLQALGAGEGARAALRSLEEVHSLLLSQQPA